MNTVKKCLFGGALMGAGLCSSANAGGVEGVFAWDVDFAFAATPFGAYNYTYGNGIIDVASESLFGYAHAQADQSGLTLFADSFDGDLTGTEARIGFVSQAFINASFNVSQSMSVTMTWDFSADISGYSYLSFDSVPYGAVGSIQLDLVAFESHLITAKMSSQLPAGPGFSATASTFTISNTVNVVPLPPAAFGGLAMLAGLGAYRCVRR